MARSTRSAKIKALWGREATALREEYNKLVLEVDEIKTKIAAHTHALDADLRTAINALSARLEEVVTNLQGHTHGGVTTGGDTSAATAAITYVQAAATLAAGDNVTGAPATITYANPEAEKIG